MRIVTIEENTMTGISDEMARRRFERIATLISTAQQDFEAHLRGIRTVAEGLGKLLEEYIQGLERISGPTPDTTRIRRELFAALAVIADPAIIPALEAAQEHFDIAAIELGTLVGALPKSP